MLTGTVIGPFTVGPVIGEGGMATVYSATHHIDESPVALKILRPEVAKQGAFLEAFGREVRAAAGLHHRRITAVFDHGVITASECEHQPELIGSPWLAMEMVTGGTISGLAGKIQWPQLQRILLEVLDGLAHAHARIMIHRDIKPGNVLFDASSGHIKVEVLTTTRLAELMKSTFHARFALNLDGGSSSQLWSNLPGVRSFQADRVANALIVRHRDGAP